MSSRHRSVLLARWRGAGGVVREVFPVAAPPVAPATPEAPAHRPDEAALFDSLAEELRAAVSGPVSDAVSRLLEESKNAWQADRTPENRAGVLAALDKIEDILDAVLLTAPRAGGGPGEPS